MAVGSSGPPGLSYNSGASSGSGTADNSATIDPHSISGARSPPPGFEQQSSSLTPAVQIKTSHPPSIPTVQKHIAHVEEVIGGRASAATATTRGFVNEKDRSHDLNLRQQQQQQQIQEKLQQQEQQRTTSYTNLVAALGESMVQSMDDDSTMMASRAAKSTPGSLDSGSVAVDSSKSSVSGRMRYAQLSGGGGRKEHQQQQAPTNSTGAASKMLLTPRSLISGGSGIASSSPTASTELGIDNFRRQSRHMASRQIGFSNSNNTGPSSTKSGMASFDGMNINDNSITGNTSYFQSNSSAQLNQGGTNIASTDDGRKGIILSSNNNDKLDRTAANDSNTTSSHIASMSLCGSNIGGLSSHTNSLNHTIQAFAVGQTVEEPRGPVTGDLLLNSSDNNNKNSCRGYHKQQQVGVQNSAGFNNNSSSAGVHTYTDQHLMQAAQQLRMNMTSASTSNSNRMVSNTAINSNNISSSYDWYGSGGRSSAPPELLDRGVPNTTALLLNRAVGSSSTNSPSCTPEPPSIGSSGGAISSSNSGVVAYSHPPSLSNTPPLDYHQQQQQHPTNNSITAATGSINSPSTEEELSIFLRETHSQDQQQIHPLRGLALLNIPPGTLQEYPDRLRSTCENFGSLETFRADFLTSKGVVFLTYHDLRASVRAAEELRLLLLNASGGSSSSSEILVRYCVPLQDCGPTDESTLLLSGVGDNLDEVSLQTIMNQYGVVRSVHYHNTPQTRGRYAIDDSSGSSYIVEFYNLQDAKQALMELQSGDDPGWGCDVGSVCVEVGMRNPSKRRQAKDLLRLIGRWRHGNTAVVRANTSSTRMSPAPQTRMSPAPPSTSVDQSHSHNSLIHHDNSSSIHPHTAQMSDASHPPPSRSTASNQTSDSSLPMPASPALSPYAPSEVTYSSSTALVSTKESAQGDMTVNDTHSGVASEQPFNHARQTVSATAAAYRPVANGNAYYPPHSSQQQQGSGRTQLVLGPDGQYSYVVLPPANSTATSVSTAPHHHMAHHYTAAPHHTPHHHPHMPPHLPQQHNHHSHHSLMHAQQVIHGPHGTYRVTTAPVAAPHPHSTDFWQQQHQPLHPAPGATNAPTAVAIMPTSYIDMHTCYPVTVYPPPPQHHHHPHHLYHPQQQQHHILNTLPSTIAAPINPIPVTNGGNNTNIKNGSSSNSNNNDGLNLRIDHVLSGRDIRTSLMVRNIPNKYTQRMLLAEFAEFGNGPDKMDFFYLPIDFKNKCNRGYAFVNFVDYQDIPSFYQLYNGKNWRVFNSDKICEMTYARIQGKEGMLRRFEHSALLEKDDEFRPLVFVSHGPNKGQREQFSSCNSSAATATKGGLPVTAARQATVTSISSSAAVQEANSVETANYPDN
eukprot:CAMPEP_0194405028 /NCGR_PEP_ID=MMETSP0176-20130528/3467_1 /TAXON_ID=216777 /ORGANISM="Proboscia alata, Strain PI-D3" /LENGTH=1358 /DNA_ID=CAMNT_0039203627 /DNA_START=82 /DNA_END=4158 /DNA_ORIENTATION=-